MEEQLPRKELGGPALDRGREGMSWGEEKKICGEKGHF